MAHNPKPYDDDDGRTIADMSGIERQSGFSFRSFSSRSSSKSDNSTEEEKPWEASPMPKGERFAWIGGALSAALLIGLTFLLGIGIFIFLLTVLWK